MRIYTIYQSTNRITGKSYIGFTSGPLSKRKCQHHNAAFVRNRNSHFYHALRKYGRESFDWSEIFQSWDKEYCLDFAENILIEDHNTRFSGYNVRAGGASGKIKDTVSYKCGACSTKLSLLPWQVRRAKVHFCDQKCKNELYSISPIPCGFCNTPLKRPPGRAKKHAQFCDQQCKVSHQIREKNQWNTNKN